MFVIDENNSISWMETASAFSYGRFSTVAHLEEIADERKWSKQTVTDIWNGFAGPFADLKPQKCFRNRKYGLERIWHEIQRLVPSDAASEPAAPLADTVEDMPKKKAKAKKAPKAKKASVTEVSARKTKRDDVVKLISREKGASIGEIMDKMGWQAHSTRGFISTLKSKHGLNIASEKSEKRGLVYKLVA